MAGYLVRSAHPRVRTRPPGGTPPPAPPQPEGSGDNAKQKMEVSILEGWRSSRAPLELECLDGVVIHGLLRGYDKYSLWVSTSDGDMLVYKHGVLRLRPRLPAAPRMRDRRTGVAATPQGAEDSEA
jgi:sRNA-binding regulator protein Hfq